MSELDFDVRRKWKPRNPIRWGDVQTFTGSGGAVQRTRELVRVESPLPTCWNVFGQLEYDPPTTPVQLCRLTILAGIGAMTQELVYRIPFFQDPTRTRYPIGPFGESLDLAPGASVVLTGYCTPIPAEWLTAFVEFSVDTGGGWGPVKISLGAAPLAPLNLWQGDE